MVFLIIELNQTVEITIWYLNCNLTENVYGYIKINKLICNYFKHLSPPEYTIHSSDDIKNRVT